MTTLSKLDKLIVAFNNETRDLPVLRQRLTMFLQVCNQLFLKCYNTLLTDEQFKHWKTWGHQADQIAFDGPTCELTVV